MSDTHEPEEANFLGNAMIGLGVGGGSLLATVALILGLYFVFDIFFG